MAVHRSKPKKRRPDVSVPGKKSPARQTGHASFAKRVKTRRRKAEAATIDATPTRANTTTGPKKLPSLRSRDERVAIARGSQGRAPRTQTPTPSTQPAQAETPRAKPTSTSPASRPKSAPAKKSPKVQLEPDDGFVAVGRVLAPFGLKGELKVQSLTDNPDRFGPKSRLHAGQQLVTITGSRDAGQHTYISLKGFPDRTSVEKFRGELLQIPESELPPLEEGEYYRFQLIGLDVFDRTGTKLGVVAEVLETGATDVYRITAPDAPDLLLPATPDVIIEIDLKQKRMVVDPPEWT